MSTEIMHATGAKIDITAKYEVPPIGDLAYMTPDVRTAILNRNGLPTGLDLLQPHEAEEDLKHEVDLFRADVANPDNYGSLKLNGRDVPMGEALTGIYKAADSLLPECNDPHFRAAARMTAMSLVGGYGLSMVTDMDGSMTDFGPSGDYSTTLFPFSGEADSLLEKVGRQEFFPRVYLNTWDRYMTDEHTKAVAFENAKHITLRTGVKSVFENIQNDQGTVTILSANFEPVVRSVLENNELGPDEVWCTAGSAIPSAKDACVAHMAQSTLAPVVYVGDGSSDKPAIEASDKVAVFFALEGAGFQKKLEEGGVPHLTYRDWTDIQNHLDLIARIRDGILVDPGHEELRDHLVAQIASI